jgi:hypothetical protein
MPSRVDSIIRKRTTVINDNNEKHSKSIYFINDEDALKNQKSQEKQSPENFSHKN